MRRTDAYTPLPLIKRTVNTCADYYEIPEWRKNNIAIIIYSLQWEYPMDKLFAQLLVDFNVKRYD